MKDELIGAAYWLCISITYKQNRGKKSPQLASGEFGDKVDMDPDLWGRRRRN